MNLDQLYLEMDDSIEEAILRGVSMKQAADAWEESKHPRGQPENAGEFASTEGATPARKTIKLAGASEDTKKATKAFFGALLKASQRNPFDDRELIIGKAGVELQPTYEGGVHINFIRSLEQGAGHASKALRTVTDLADKHGITLTLDAAPMPHHVKDKKAALNKRQLFEWYGRNGFTRSRQRGVNDFMVRVPQSKATKYDPMRGQQEAGVHPNQIVSVQPVTHEMVRELVRNNNAAVARKQLHRLVTAGTARKVLFEVAPDPNNKAVADQWNRIDERERTAISTTVLASILPEVLTKTGAQAKMHLQYGGYLDDTNPSMSLVLARGVTDEQAGTLTHVLGAVLSQDSMALVSKKPFKGSSEMGAVVVKVPKNITFTGVKTLYNALRGAVKAEDGSDLINGHTTDAGRMVILVDKDKAQEITDKVFAALKGEYDVGHDVLNVAWPEKGDNNYGFKPGQDKSGRGSSRASLREWVGTVHTKAAGILQQQIDQHQHEGERKAA